MNARMKFVNSTTAFLSGKIRRRLLGLKIDNKGIGSVSSPVDLDDVGF